MGNKELLIAGAAGGVGVTCLLLEVLDQSKPQESLDSLILRYGLQPSLPFPQEYTQSVDIGERKISVVGPDILRDHYGISVKTVKKGFNSLIEGDDLQLFIRNTPETFNRVFGFLYNRAGLDPHIARKELEIILVENGWICGGGAQDALVEDDASNWAIEQVRDFKQIIEREKFGRLPRLGFFNGEMFGGNIPLKDNLAMFDHIIGVLKEDRKIQQYLCSFTPPSEGIIYGATRPWFPIAHFLKDDTGKIVTAPDGIPLIALKSRIYIAVGHSSLFQSYLNIKHPAELQTDNYIYRHQGVGSLIVHETRHAEEVLDPNVGFRKIGSEDRAEHAETVYGENADLLLTGGDDSGFLFVLCSKNHGNVIAETKPEVGTMSLFNNPVNILAGALCLSISKKMEETEPPELDDGFLSRRKFISRALRSVGGILTLK